MKKIGILFGQENTFPQAFVDEVNARGEKDIVAELAHVDELYQGKASGYAVLIDRISQDVPFYRAYLKNAAYTGTAVINNPFWWSADEKFFNNVLAQDIGVAVPKTILLPSHTMPPDTKDSSFRNLKFPLDWDGIFAELGGFPLFCKPHAGGGWKSVYKVHDEKEFFDAYHETGTLVMMLQEAIEFDSYFRCYGLGAKWVHIMPYEPRNPHHLRYLQGEQHTDPKLLKTIEEQVILLNDALGYDFNTVEFAVRDGIPYAIDFCNPAPDADVNSIGESNFHWILKHAADLSIERAKAYKPGKMNLRWGTCVQRSVKEGYKNPAPKKK
ncbi:MAG: hypothetical protein KDC57_22840 [Saprospiraceae bacterium]|nr:hypothetical protein [Saprospiraceae bacterium]